MFIVMAAVLLMLIPVRSQDPDCSTISDPGARLACYDADAGAAIDDPDRPANYRIGPWLVALRVDPTTDEEMVGLAVTADGTSTGSAVPHPTLLFRCVGGTFDALIDWERFVQTGGEEISVALRVDAQREQVTKWSMSADGTTAFALDGADNALLSSLYFAERLEVSVTPDDESSLTATFNVSGLLDAARPLWAVCPPR